MQVKAHEPKRCGSKAQMAPVAAQRNLSRQTFARAPMTHQHASSKPRRPCQREVLRVEVPRMDGVHNVRRSASATGLDRALANGLTHPSSLRRALDDRPRCPFCNRGFGNVRPEDHVSICGKLKQARPRSPDGSSTQLPKRIYCATQGRFILRENKLDLARDPEQNESSSRAAPREQEHDVSPEQFRHLAPGPASSSTWRAKHQELIARIQDGKYDSRGGPDWKVLVPEKRPLSAPPISSQSDREFADDSCHALSSCVNSSPETDPRRKKVPVKQKARKLIPEDNMSPADELNSPFNTALKLILPRTPSTSDNGCSSSGSIDSSPESLKSQRSLVPKGPAIGKVCTRRSRSCSASASRPRSSHARQSALVTQRLLPSKPHGIGLSQGIRVQVHGLQCAQHLNGLTAVLLAFDADAQCWLAGL